MLFRNIVTVCFEINTRYTNTMCRYNAEFCNVNIPPSGEVKKEYSYISAPTVRLHGADSESLTFNLSAPEFYI
jgi:hypothetical protein